MADEAAKREDARGRTTTRALDGSRAPPREIRMDRGGHSDEPPRYGEQAKSFLEQKLDSNRLADAGVVLDFHPQLLGADVVEIDEELWDDAAAEWKNALVGFVFGAKLSFGKLKAFVNSRWGDEHVVKVSQMPKGAFLFSFTSKEALDRIVDKGPWTFDHGLLFLKDWSPDEDYAQEGLKTLPLWVRFPGLRNHCRRQDVLGMIASTIGKPLRTDGFTVRRDKLDYGRDLIEISAAREFKSSVKINTGRLRLAHCHSFGHSHWACSVPKISMEEPIGKFDNVLIEPVIPRMENVQIGQEKESGVGSSVIKHNGHSKEESEATEESSYSSGVPETQNPTGVVKGHLDLGDDFVVANRKKTKKGREERKKREDPSKLLKGKDLNVTPRMENVQIGQQKESGVGSSVIKHNGHSKEESEATEESSYSSGVPETQNPTGVVKGQLDLGDDSVVANRKKTKKGREERKKLEDPSKLLKGKDLNVSTYNRRAKRKKFGVKLFGIGV